MSVKRPGNKTELAYQPRRPRTKENHQPTHWLSYPRQDTTRSAKVKRKGRKGAPLMECLRTSRKPQEDALQVKISPYGPPKAGTLTSK